MSFETNGRWLIRTGHLDDLGWVTIEDVRLTVKRGAGLAGGAEPMIQLRVNRDNQGFGRWISRGLGLPGDRYNTIMFGGMGTATDWQFEIQVTDDCDVELQELEILPTELGY